MVSALFFYFPTDLQPKFCLNNLLKAAAGQAVPQSVTSFLRGDFLSSQENFRHALIFAA